VLTHVQSAPSIGPPTASSHEVRNGINSNPTNGSLKKIRRPPTAPLLDHHSEVEDSIKVAIPASVMAHPVVIDWYGASWELRCNAHGWGANSKKVNGIPTFFQGEADLLEHGKSRHNYHALSMSWGGYKHLKQHEVLTINHENRNGITGTLSTIRAYCFALIFRPFYRNHTNDTRKRASARARAGNEEHKIEDPEA
jgi:hypothetical protein